MIYTEYKTNKIANTTITIKIVLDRFIFSTLLLHTEGMTPCSLSKNYLRFLTCRSRIQFLDYDNFPFYKCTFPERTHL